MRQRGGVLALLLVAGCTSLTHPTNGIHGLPPVPLLPPAPVPNELPQIPEKTSELGPPRKLEGLEKTSPATEPPKGKEKETEPGGDDQLALAAPFAHDRGRGADLQLEQVLDSVARHFPLLLAVQEERAIAEGQRLAAEGAFDTNLRARLSQQGGTFPNTRFDAGIEQATPIQGISFFSGYRFGQDEFPVYYGDRLTADGGEFRAGLTVPLLRDAAIDRRRAAARQAAIQRALAEPAVQRARIDYFRAAARAYWSWVAAAEQVHLAQDLLRIARERQRGLETQFKKGQISEFLVVDNRRAVVEREGILVAAERRFQQGALELSLYYRDEAGNPIVPAGAAIPQGLADQTAEAPDLTQLETLVELAAQWRPELERFALQKERLAVERRLAENQLLPGLNASVFGSQDVGKGKKGTGTSALERSVIEGALTLDVPLQRREAAGRLAIVRAQMTQLLRQEQFARDQITFDVQDALSNLDRGRERIEKARQERTIAERVATMETERFLKGQSSLLEVNLRELSAAGALGRVIDAVADFRRAQADLRAALGQDARTPKK